MKETSPHIDAFLSFLRNCEQQFHMAEADEREANNETQDISTRKEAEAALKKRKKEMCGEPRRRSDD